MLRKAARPLLLFLACCLLPACSSPKFVYNRLDFLLPWYVDDYVDLNRQQKKSLDQQLEPFLSWHRSTELPCYVELLDHIELSLDETLTTADIERLSAEFELAWNRTQSEALEWVVTLGEELSEEQVAEFLEELRKREEELKEELLERDDKEYRKESYDNFVDNLGDYMGRLEKDQQVQVRDVIQNIIRADALWLKDRAIVIAKIEELMAREPGWQVRAREMAMTQADNTEPVYWQALQHNITLFQALTAELLNNRTQKQDKRLRKRLASLRDDFKVLATQSGLATQLEISDPAELASQSENPSSCEAPSSSSQS